MKSTINKLTLFIGIACLAACADDSLDPFRLKDQSKGSILALRGDSFDALNDNGCSNSFFRNKIVGDETFVMDVEYLSEDPTSLEEIQVYVHYQKADPDNPGEFVEDKRGPANTFPGSALSSADGGNPTGTLSLPLSKILSDAGVTVTNGVSDMSPDDVVTLESDLLLKNGTIVLSTSVVNVGLYQSGIFYPAQTLTFCHEDINDYYPKPKFKLRVGRPLKAGSKDTLNITYASEIATAPTATLPVGSAGTLTPVEADPKDKTGTKFYAIFTAGAGYTGPIEVSVSGAVNGGEGATAGLVQKQPSLAPLQVDNTPPQIVGVPIIENLANPAAGQRIGRDQFVSITLNFQEALDLATDTLLISVTGQNLDPVTDAEMVVAPNGKSASYVYTYKDTDDDTQVTAGDLTFVVSSGADLAGNAFGGTTFNLLNDVGEPKQPVVTLDANYDYGDDIKWSATTATGPSDPGGSTSGTIMFAVVNHGDPAPAQATTTIKGVTVNSGFDWGSGEPLETGSFRVIEGKSDETLSHLTSNGDLDVYFYFVNATGNASKNTGPTQINMQ
jgi:hypothetical protein